MKVLLLNHNEEYAVREMIGAFFPKIQIEYVSTIPQGDDFILSEYVYSQNNHTFFCKCNIAGKVFSDTITEEFFDSNTIKKTIYNTLKKATGIDIPWGILTGIRPSKMVRELKGRNLANVGQYLTTSIFVNEQKSKLAIEVEMN